MRQFVEFFSFDAGRPANPAKLDAPRIAPGTELRVDDVRQSQQDGRKLLRS